ncbi:endonuclease/exonuclease/phosphatase family protein [Streptomyces sp. NPDC006784]|uniref:endonuclease/exonuclease/phosphatase family protein n=1 Tax=Streptomyces sp. NPDC006784 TaxID=3364764 RepID=UPI0036C64056
MTKSVERPAVLVSALCSVVLVLQLLSGAGQARAGEPATAKSAGRRYALMSQANGKYVAAEIHDADNQYGKLRARADSVGAWETFTLHTDSRGQNAALRAEVNGRYVSAEFHDGGRHDGMLRARRDGPIGAWERFSLVPLPGGWYALEYTENGRDRYVSAEVEDSGSDYGLLRARATTIGSWERFRLVPLPEFGTGDPPSPTRSARQVRAMTWNLCTNNSACAMYSYTAAQFAQYVATGAADAGSPQVIFFQEFCEKLAKPLELELEKRLGRGGWDVRFAPIRYRIAQTGQQAQKACAKNRGAYGVAVAVPDENTWYRRFDLPSPDGKEQRTALCAAVRSWGVMACSAHFSTGGPGYDDPTREFQADQAGTLAAAVRAHTGYRPVFGGDLNATASMTPDGESLPVLGPLYDSFAECDAQNGGRPTKGSLKLDHLFAPADAAWSACRLSGSVGSSDHQALWGTVRLPAG